ncbi:response regulator [Cohnella phaseoli]|uniref:YesN/AraC family two-component response regulator n=2 Tax=Cohnella TaxID=329857 RepID=A0A3D9KCX1_9BACL|nr:response regulator [Cohnella phaseoli]RED84248.1 YesN/AraC family two-component response regulator [Cohnella phaseoli]
MNILVLEDEPIALEELELLLKEFEPEHAVFAAPNGVEGLALAGRFRPDLVVTDIRMPGMDGLDFIRRLKLDYPDAEAILVSGYDDFAYARTGLQLGVKDFLVKPVKRQELIHAVSAVLESLKEKRRLDREEERWRLVRALEGRTSNEPEELAGPVLLAISLLGNWKSGHVWQRQEEAVRPALAECAPDSYILYPEANLQCLLFPCGSSREERAAHEAIGALHEAFKRTKLPVHTTVFFKKGGERPEEAYRRALGLLERQVRLETSTLSSSGVDGDRAMDMTSVWNSIRLLEAHLAKRDFKQIRPSVDKIVTQAKLLQLPAKTIAQMLADMFTALQFKLHPGRNAAIAEAEAIADITEQAVEYAQLADWLTERLIDWLEELGGGGKEPRELVRKLMGDIRRSYDRIDSLHSFAKEHHISISHLSRLFKKEAGVNFSDYLIGVRMEQAKALLASEALSVIEVSGRVGYEDSKYFSQLFKKHTGMTPSEYQKSRKIVPPK